MKTAKSVCTFTSRSFKPATGLLGLTLLVTGLWLTGCAPDSGVNNNASDKKVADMKAAGCTGAYTLVTINGNAVPCQTPHEGGGPLVTAGSFTINADGTCSSKMELKAPAGTPASIERKATYTREGNKLHMKWQGFGQTIGTVEGNNFTMDNEGVMFAYRK